MCDIQEGCLRRADSSERCTLFAPAPFFFSASHIDEMAGATAVELDHETIENEGLMLRKAKQKNKKDTDL